MPRMPLLATASVIVLAAAQGAIAADGEISQVLLSSGGLAEVVRSFDADGNASISMTVPANQVDDVLKSLVVADPGGTVTGVSLVGSDNVAEAFRTLPFGPNDLASPAAVAAAMRGFEVTVDDGEGQKATGIILGVADVLRATTVSPVAVPAVALQTETGAVRQVVLGPAATLAFTDPVIAGRIADAGRALRGGKDGGARSVKVETAGAGQRGVGLSYVTAAPVWKVAYRAIAGSDGKARIQGWAVLENATGEDWNDVTVTLSSSNPVALKQRLYDMVWRERPEAPLALPGGSVNVPVDDGRLRMATKRALGENARSEMAPAAPMTSMAELEDMNMADMPGEPEPEYQPQRPSEPTEQALAVEGDVGIRFTIPRPVDLASGHTLSVPIVDADYEAEVVSLWRPNSGNRHPVAALFVTNGPDASLPPGIFTIYDPDGYLGDAQILGIPPSEMRYAAFAADPKVSVESDIGLTETIEDVRAAKGVVTISRRHRQTTTYTVTGPAKASRTVMIDHPRQIGWEVSSQSEIVSEDGSELRLKARLAPGEEEKVTVVETMVAGEELRLLDTDAGTLLAWANTGGISKEVAASFRKLAILRGEVSDAEEAVREAERDFERLGQDQDRIRQNLSAVPSTSDLANTYLEKMAELDREIAETVGERDKAEAELAKLRKEYGEAVLAF